MERKSIETLLGEYLEHTGMTVSNFAEVHHIPKTTVQGWKEGKSSSVALALLKVLLELEECKRTAFLLDELECIILRRGKKETP